VMSRFRLARPRYLACFAFEGGLILSVLYALALMNLKFEFSTDPANLVLTVTLTGGLYMAILIAIQTATIGSRSGLDREIVLFSVVSFLAGLLLFGALWATSLEVRWLPTLLAIEGAFAIPLAVAVWRWVSVRFDFLDVNPERVLIVGVGETARQLCRTIVEEHSADYDIVGFAGDDTSRSGTLLAMGKRIQSDFSELPRFAVDRVDRVIVALDEKRGKLPVEALMEVRLLGIEIEDNISFQERVGGKLAVDSMLPSWLIFSEGFKASKVRAAVKRANDLIHALVLLIAAAPMMLLTAVLIKLDSRGPVLYRQGRLGRYGDEFQVLKFRSMRQDAEKTTGPTWAQAGDPRVTRIGRIIRKLRIDELPQIINVLKGDMSFVGPRPERAHFVNRLEQQIPYYGLRMTVRPGITGWAQVEYHYGATDEDALEKLKYDLYYIKNNNLFLDLWIVLKTVKVVLLGTGAR